MSEGGRLTRADASAAVGELGWRYILGTLRTSARVGSLAASIRLAAQLTEAAGAPAGDSLTLDVRHDRLVLTLHDRVIDGVTAREVDLARRISAAAQESGVVLDAVSSPPDAPGRSDQIIEIAVDALDIPAVRPFWKAVMAYVDTPDADDAGAALIDPVGQGPAIWFQQMDAPRPQRNRIHFDISVPHDEAPGRIAAVLAAGGKLLSDAHAPAFWVLADPEGNEACITTWQGRD